VKWFGAVQAQDYLGALWAIGLRMRDATEKTVEQALAERKLIRTWPMRGTLHFVAPADARWMLKLLTPRIIARCAGLHRQAGLDESVFSRSRDALVKALQGGKQFSARRDVQGVRGGWNFYGQSTRPAHFGVAGANRSDLFRRARR
jgi:hypothetical protein